MLCSPVTPGPLGWERRKGVFVSGKGKRERTAGNSFSDFRQKWSGIQGGEKAPGKKDRISGAFRGKKTEHSEENTGRKSSAKHFSAALGEKKWGSRVEKKGGHFTEKVCKTGAVVREELCLKTSKKGGKGRAKSGFFKTIV